MLVKDAIIPPGAWRVRVSLLARASGLRGKAGIAWPDPRSGDLRNWALIVPGRPSVCYVHADFLQVIGPAEGSES